MTPRRFTGRRAGIFALAGGALSLLLASAPAGAQSCAGDCNDSNSVEVNELVTGVNISLGTKQLSECPSFDCQGTGMVPVSCLVRAVNTSLMGCNGTPGPTM